MRRTVIALLLLVGCAHTRSKPAKCPDTPPCMTTPACSYDEETGCEVCHCGDSYIDRGSEPPPGQAPFPNH